VVAYFESALPSEIQCSDDGDFTCAPHGVDVPIPTGGDAFLFAELQSNFLDGLDQHNIGVSMFEQVVDEVEALAEG
jgi:hypothetical protein